MHYRAPPLPVDLRFLNSSSMIGSVNAAGGLVNGTSATEPQRAEHAEIDREAHMKQFRHIALNKHNIRLN